MFVGGNKNGLYQVVEEPGLTQQVDSEQYILTEVDGKEVYSLAGLCFREVRATARTLWKKQQTPTMVEYQNGYAQAAMAAGLPVHSTDNSVTLEEHPADNPSSMNRSGEDITEGSSHDPSDVTGI